MLSALAAVVPFLIWPRLRERLFTTDFLPHLYCYMRNPALVWTYVVADTLIGTAYLAISVTLGYLTAHSDRATVDRARGTDHDGFILKPFHRRELQSAIEVAMLRRAVKAKEKEQ
jgi:hypothetical protein